MGNLLLAVAIAFTVGAAGAWKTQSWRYGEQINAIHLAHQEALTKAVSEVREREQANLKKLQDAENEANQRAVAQRIAAERAQLESTGLRERLAAIRRELPTITDTAARERADTLGELLGDCADRYRGVADKAQRHANDAQRLIESWPN